MKIEDVVKIRDNAANRKAELRNEINALVAKSNALQADMEKAQEIGDIEAYKAAKEEHDNTLFKIGAARAKLARPSYNTPEILSAWNGYAEKYNKEFSKRMDSFRKKTMELGKEYMELAKLQNEAMKNRGACGSLIGGNGEHPAMIELQKLPDDFGHHPDIKFFHFYGALTRTEAMNVQFVVNGSTVESFEAECPFPYLYNIK